MPSISGPNVLSGEEVETKRLRLQSAAGCRSQEYGSKKPNKWSRKRHQEGRAKRYAQIAPFFASEHALTLAKNSPVASELSEEDIVFGIAILESDLSDGDRCPVL